jgi:hypothetical protein
MAVRNHGYARLASLVVAELRLLKEEKNFILMMRMPNNALHRTAIPPRIISQVSLVIWGNHDAKLREILEV